MKTKHTSGPWYYSNYAGTFMLQDGPYYEDNLILSYDEAFSDIDMETAEANAKLAAAAPDLLESEIKNLEFLRWITTQLSSFNMYSDKRELLYQRIAATEEAIKKAT